MLKYHHNDKVRIHHGIRGIGIALYELRSVEEEKLPPDTVTILEELHTKLTEVKESYAPIRHW